MKILFLTYDLPYPLDQGGKIRAYHLIKNLAKKHRLTVFSFIRRPSQLRDVKQLKPFCQEIVLFSRMKAFSPSHLLTTLRPNLPFPVALYWSAALKRKLEEEVVKENYDLVHFESFYTSLYLSKKIKIPQVLGTENIEWRVYRDFAGQQKIPFLKVPLFWENWRTRLFEEKTWRQADVCLAVSRENAAEITAVSGKKTPVIPNGVDLEFFRYQPMVDRQRKTILFVGNFAYIQNQDAVRFLVKEIFPLIKKEIEGVKLLLVGRQPTREIQNYASSEIKVRPDVEDIREAYALASLLLAPIRVGSGTKFKILEAMASGLPVVTTPVGIEGINAQQGKEVIVQDQPVRLTDEVVKLLADQKRSQKLGRAGYDLVSQHYVWTKISQKLEAVYQQLINGKKD